ncbi:MAG TPA: hypothetical protein VNZ62_02100 [Capillimicrobium sp.]|nr:hypothetical protein [Capillimicrobium sp.]
MSVAPAHGAARARTIPPPVRRLPLLAGAAVALVFGLWTGLQRLGVDVPELRWTLAALHGPLLVLGFLGTQIGLERAVALGRSWPYLAPAATAAGALWLVLGLPADAGRALLTAGGVALVAASVAVYRRQPGLPPAIMGLGAVAWSVGGVAWLAGAAVVAVVPWLAAFLVLTIVGERLELSRVRRPSRRAVAVLLAAIAAFLAGVALADAAPAVGVRLAGAGLLAQAAWLARCDVALRTIRRPGAPRYMAAAMLAGTAWLAVAGVAWLVEGDLAGAGLAYDAMVHALFLGFVFSMVFAHAPVIVPAVLGVALPFTRAMYVPLALLQAGLVVRVAGDLAGSAEAARWGGVIDEAAIVLFVAVAVVGARRARRR